MLIQDWKVSLVPHFQTSDAGQIVIAAFNSIGPYSSYNGSPEGDSFVIKIKRWLTFLLLVSLGYNALAQEVD